MAMRSLCRLPPCCYAYTCLCMCGLLLVECWLQTGLAAKRCCHVNTCICKKKKKKVSAEWRMVGSFSYRQPCIFEIACWQLTRFQGPEGHEIHSIHKWSCQRSNGGRKRGDEENCSYMVPIRLQLLNPWQHCGPSLVPTEAERLFLLLSVQLPAAVQPPLSTPDRSRYVSASFLCSQGKLYTMQNSFEQK